MTSTQESPTLSVKEAAAALGVTVDSVHSYIKRHHLSATMQGGQYHIDAEAVQKFTPATKQEGELSTKEVAERLGVTPLAVNKMINAGHLKATKRLKNWYVTEAALAAYIEKKGTQRYLKPHNLKDATRQKMSESHRNGGSPSVTVTCTYPGCTTQITRGKSTLKAFSFCPEHSAKGGRIARYLRNLPEEQQQQQLLSLYAQGTPLGDAYTQITGKVLPRSDADKGKEK